MYHYIEGLISELTPTYVVIDVNGVGYYINITLNTYSNISSKERCRLYVHLIIREDAHLLYGFSDIVEKNIFLDLLGVPGIGASTARMILSSMGISEFQQAIVSGNVSLLQSVKGIGQKSAQRIVVDLKGKYDKAEFVKEIFNDGNNKLKEDALLALMALGFPKSVGEKAIMKVFRENPSVDKLEDLIKMSLKNMG